MSTPVDFTKISKHAGPEESPGFLLWRVSTSWRKSIEEVLTPLNLTHPQFVILATTGWLNRKGKPVSQADISRQSGLDPNTTSQVLRGLQSKGLIERLAIVDERSKQPVLTKEGKKLLTKALPAVEEADQKFFSKVKNSSSLVALLQKLA